MLPLFCCCCYWFWNASVSCTMPCWLLQWTFQPSPSFVQFLFS